MGEFRVKPPRGSNVRDNLTEYTRGKKVFRYFLEAVLVLLQLFRIVLCSALWTCPCQNNVLGAFTSANATQLFVGLIVTSRMRRIQNIIGMLETSFRTTYHSVCQADRFIGPIA